MTKFEPINPEDIEEVEVTIEQQGKRTCMVKEKFKEALANIRYIHYNNVFDEKINRIKFQIEELEKEVAVREERTANSEELVAQQQKVQELQETVAQEQASLEKFAQDGLAEEQMTMLQDTADKHAEELKQAEKVLNKNVDLQMIESDKKRIARLQRLIEKKHAKRERLSSSVNLNQELKGKYEKKASVGKEEDEYFSRQEELQKEIEKTEQEQKQQQDEYWNTVDQYTKEALKTGDASQLQRLNEEKKQNDVQNKEVLQNLSIQKTTVTDLLNSTRKEKRKLSIQTSLPYVFAKGVKSVLVASFADMKESARLRKEKKALQANQDFINDQPVVENPNYEMDDMESNFEFGEQPNFHTAEPIYYDAEEANYRSNVYTMVDDFLNYSQDDPIAREQFANLLKSYQRMYEGEEATSEKEGPTK